MNIKKLNFLKKIVVLPIHKVKSNQLKQKKSVKCGCILLLSLILLLTGCESFNDFTDTIQQAMKMPCDQLSAKKFLEQEYETNDAFAYYRKFKLRYNIKSAYALDTQNGYSVCIVRLDYSSNRTVSKMVNSILDTKISLIDADFGGIELKYKEDVLGKIYFDTVNPSLNTYFESFDRNLRRLDKELKNQTCDLAYQFKLVGVDIKEVNEKYGYKNKCINY